LNLVLADVSAEKQHCSPPSIQRRGSAQIEIHGRLAFVSVRDYGQHASGLYAFARVDGWDEGGYQLSDRLWPCQSILPKSVGPSSSAETAVTPSTSVARARPAFCSSSNDFQKLRFPFLAQAASKMNSSKASFTSRRNSFIEKIARNVVKPLRIQYDRR
jgi:hypothetical protein